MTDQTMLANELEKHADGIGFGRTYELLRKAVTALRTAAPAAEPGDVRIISDEMVTAACATYELVYVDNDRSMEEAMRDALRAALANPAPAQGEPVTALPQAPSYQDVLECARQAIEYSIDMGGTDPAGVLLQTLNKIDAALALSRPHHSTPTDSAPDALTPVQRPRE